LSDTILVVDRHALAVWSWMPFALVWTIRGEGEAYTRHLSRRPARAMIDPAELRDVFDRAASLPPEERATFLDECAAPVRR
jgi:hypothetical protein